jgi:hypothetical protein
VLVAWGLNLSGIFYISLELDAWSLVLDAWSLALGRPGRDPLAWRLELAACRFISSNSFSHWGVKKFLILAMLVLAV